jgi:Protein of unknown function (DUF2909)
MFIKIFIVLVLIAILFSLGSGLYHLTKGREHSTRLAKALTARISISIALFVLLLIAFATGMIQPHGIREGLVEETQTDKQ